RFVAIFDPPFHSIDGGPILWGRISGSAASDGLVNGTLPSSLAGFMSVEMSEHRYPLRFQKLGIREESSGPGRHRGGCGTEFSITALADCHVSVLGDRVDHSPFGINGGGDAQPNRVRFNIDDTEWTAPSRVSGWHT
ncbi:MAG: hydantoinase B/oxoprolinase family protein, partial [Rhodospirillaceae bacterium]